MKEFKGDPREVWKRASSVRDIPDYWHGTRSFDVVGEKQGVIHAKVRFAFGGSGEADFAVDEGSRTVTIEYVSGPFTGRQVIVVNEGAVMAKWDIKFKGVFRLASRWNGGHFRSGTVHALERLIG